MKRRTLLSLPFVAGVSAVIGGLFGRKADAGPCHIGMDVGKGPDRTAVAVYPEPGQAWGYEPGASDSEYVKGKAYWDTERKRWAVFCEDGKELHGLGPKGSMTVCGWTTVDRLTVEVRMVQITDVREGRPDTKGGYLAPSEFDEQMIDLLNKRGSLGGEVECIHETMPQGRLLGHDARRLL